MMKLKFYFDLYIFKRIKIYIILQEAKENIEKNQYIYSCSAIMNSIYKYLHVYLFDVSKLIPHFNSIYLTGKDKLPGEPWWDSEDKKSRLNALDKLIKEYKESGGYIYKKDINKINLMEI